MKVLFTGIHSVENHRKAAKMKSGRSCKDMPTPEKLQFMRNTKFAPISFQSRRHSNDFRRICVGCRGKFLSFFLV